MFYTNAKVEQIAPGSHKVTRFPQTDAPPYEPDPRFPFQFASLQKAIK